MAQTIYVEENLNLPKDVREVRYKFFIGFNDDNVVIFEGTGIGIAFNISEKEAKDIIERYLIANNISPIYTEQNFMIFGYDDHEKVNELKELVSLLFFFKEYVKSNREYRKYAEALLSINFYELLFWYSRAVEYSKKGEEYAKKVVKAFKELYL